jgi:tRNA pseudouridine38-40 synthase
MVTWKITLEYDGRAFSGWQRQANARSVQEVVDTALTRIFGGERIVLHVAGRTDAGVHALGQVASFRAETPRTEDKVRMGLNTVLPDEVSCLSALQVEPEFHARRSALGKTYRYLVLERRDRSPFWAGRAANVRRPLDWAAIESALPDLVTTTDMSAFRGPACEARDPVRTVDRAAHTLVDGIHRLEFSGPGFLRYQVRIMVGTLLEIGMGRRPADDIPRILATRDRTSAGRTARPEGLYLVEVRY